MRRRFELRRHRAAWRGDGSAGSNCEFIAFFDLDNTLLGGDSDYLWGEYLAQVGAVPEQEHRAKNRRFLEEYRRGKLNPAEFLSFQLAPLALHERATLESWRASFVDTWIRPLVLPKALSLVAHHRAQGHRIVIATSTNSFIVRPIADLFRVEDLLATQPEEKQGRFTGRVLGEPCFARGKVSHARAFTASHGGVLSESWFYTDSHTDLPLLQVVAHPVAVDPDEELARVAAERGWTVLSLRS